MSKIFYATVTLIITLQAIFLANIVHNRSYDIEIYDKIRILDEASAFIIVVIYIVYVIGIIKSLKK